jgi:hypothetical protein
VACAEYWDNHVDKQQGYNLVSQHIIIKAGNIDVLKWALNKNFPLHQDACYFAAKNGHVESATIH